MSARTCKEADCKELAVFGTVQYKPIHCKDHRLSTEWAVRCKLCEVANCHKQATHGTVAKKPMRCSAHKQAGDTDVLRDLCPYPDCGSHPVFGVPGGRPIHCAKHKELGEIDVKHTHCKAPGCEKRAIYGEHRAEYCPAHGKELGFGTKSHPVCQEPNCADRARHGTIGKKPIHCRAHKTKTEQQVDSKYCKESGCKKLAGYGITKGRPIHCGSHRTEQEYDVVSRKCVECNTQANFGLIEKRPTHCDGHRKADMFNVVMVRCEGNTNGKLCCEGAYYGYPGYGPIRCRIHYLAKMVHRPNQACYKDHCVECDDCGARVPYEQTRCDKCQNYLTEKITVKFKAKEDRVARLLDANKIKYVRDRTIDSLCGLERPDFQIETPTGLAILEVDENQHKHKDYGNSECVRNRMKNIFMACGGCSVVFIRYNPDKYSSSGAQVRVPQREAIVLSILRELMKSGHPAGLWVIHLFYDGYEQDASLVYDQIDPYEIQKKQLVRRAIPLL